MRTFLNTDIKRTTIKSLQVVWKLLKDTVWLAQGQHIQFIKMQGIAIENQHDYKQQNIKGGTRRNVEMKKTERIINSGVLNTNPKKLA